MSMAERMADKRRRFPHPLGVALVPDHETLAHVLAVAEVAFRTVNPLNNIKICAEQAAHVSIFQNLFRDPVELTEFVKMGLGRANLDTRYPLQLAPRDFDIWAVSRPFVNIKVSRSLAVFHDFLLERCIVSGKDVVCAGCPADSSVLTGLSPEEQRAYEETGYVFSGAGTLTNGLREPWSAFSRPHFTLGIFDWASRPAGETIESAQKRITSEMRECANKRGFVECQFDRVVIFRVQLGGVFLPSADTTIAEYRLRS